MTALLDLRGRTAIVTGAAGAFGRPTLDVLRHLGVSVVGIDRKPGPDIVACDITDADQVKIAIAEAVETLGGRLDLLIHYAGIGPAVDVGLEPADDVYAALEVNLLGAWRVTAAAIPALLDGGGRVIITASLLAGVTMPFAGAYTVSKRALAAYADTLRIEYAPVLEVTTVYPGYVDTPIHDRSRALGVSLDGQVPAERVRDTVLAVVRAARLKRPKRDFACTPLGTATLHLARHAPGLVDSVVAAQLRRRARTGHFAGADLAYGLHARLGLIPEGQR